jgi:hypothetical protein
MTIEPRKTDLAVTHQSRARNQKQVAQSPTMLLMDSREALLDK